LISEAQKRQLQKGGDSSLSPSSNHGTSGLFLPIKKLKVQTNSTK